MTTEVRKETVEKLTREALAAVRTKPEDFVLILMALADKAFQAGMQAHHEVTT